LGKDENLNVVKPDIMTAGESLALLIKYGNCPLKTLKVNYLLIKKIMLLLRYVEVVRDTITISYD